MADYIDRDKYCAITCRCDKNYCGRTSCAIWTAKSEDVSPVVHGTWLLRHIGHGHYWECSICHATPIYVTNNTNYCPNCGAKMDDDHIT